MSRRKRAVERKIDLDPLYGDYLVAKFINHLMLDGKKSIAEKILYKALDRVSEKTKLSHVESLEKIVEATQPLVEIKTRRIGGATYPIPVEVRASRKDCLAIKWIIESARKRAKDSMENKLVAECLDALEGKGNAIKKRNEVHRIAESNKAFAHFKF